MQSYRRLCNKVRADLIRELYLLTPISSATPPRNSPLSKLPLFSLPSSLVSLSLSLSLHPSHPTLSINSVPFALNPRNIDHQWRRVREQHTNQSLSLFNHPLWQDFVIFEIVTRQPHVSVASVERSLPVSHKTTSFQPFYIISFNTLPHLLTNGEFVHSKLLCLNFEVFSFVIPVC